MTRFLQEILQQPEAVLATAEYYTVNCGRESLAMFAEAVKSTKRIVATGMGSSSFLSGALQTFLSRHGIAVTVINAGELLNYQLDVITPDTLLVAISQSGESYETVNVVKRLDAMSIKPRVAVITNEPASTLGRRADILLPTFAGDEEKTSTKTFITGFQIIYMISQFLGGNSSDISIWRQVAGEIEQVLDSRDNILSGMLDALGSASYVQFVARGTSLASASQSALMVMEASHTPSQALAGGEFRHGPLEMVGEGFIAVVIAHSASPTFEQTRRLVADILRFGGRVVLVTDNCKALDAVENLTVVAVNTYDADLFAITGIIPVQLAVEAWARIEKGIEPGVFSHGAKVTVIE